MKETQDAPLRAQLKKLLGWEDAHVGFEAAVEGVGPAHQGKTPPGLPFSPWQLLEQHGARVVMTRTTNDPVELALRPIIARRENANAFVSVHLNAYGDGVNPFVARNGSGTYFFHRLSEPLARPVQRGLVRQMGLPNLGVYYDNLAVVRGTWMPMVLTEGAFVIIPEQEAAIRTPEFQARYAQGIVDGLEEYFRWLGKQ